MEKPIAYFDLDGTLADYDFAMNESLARLKAPEEPDCKWGWNEAPDYIEARMDLIKSHGEWWENLPPFPLLDLCIGSIPILSAIFLE